MTIQTWAEARDRERVRLAEIGRLPDHLRNHLALRKMALICVVSRSSLETRLIGNSIRARLITKNMRHRIAMVREILGQIVAELRVDETLNHYGMFSLRAWLSQRDFDDFIVQTIRSDVADHDRAALLREVNAADVEVGKLTEMAQRAHLRGLGERDLPDFPVPSDKIPLVLRAWLLAARYDRHAERAVIVNRRVQAFTAYAALQDLLMEDEVTIAIDEGRPLAPLLMARLKLPKAALRALVGARSLTVSPGWHDWGQVVSALRDHEVPLHEWPGGGQPYMPSAWAESPWVNTSAPVSGLTRPDYHGKDTAQVKDAVEAFKSDFLRPLLASRIAALQINRDYAAQALEHIVQGQSFHRGDDKAQIIRREFLRLVRQVLIGPRRPKSFQEAAAIWHRRAAAIAAVRDEHRTQRPGWPPLCASWRSDCGAFTIVPLTTAAALVAEGNAHQHCVGGYYDQCRAGDTQILSLQRDHEPVATVEVLLGHDWKYPVLTIGQFKGWHDKVADAKYHPVLRSFLAAIRSGAHQLNARKLAAYRKWAHANSTPWSAGPLSLEHARSVYPLYRSLLPRPSADSFDVWVEESGLRAGLGQPGSKCARRASSFA